MENLLTIQPQTSLHYDESSLDLEDFFKDSLEPLMKKFKSRLSQYVNSEKIQNYTLTKVDKAYCLLDSLGQEWQERSQKAIDLKRQLLDFKLLQDPHHPCFMMTTPPDLMSAMMELSKKYHELDLDNDNLDDTIDTFLIKIEELDGKISDTLDHVDKMRERLEEKIIKVAGVANEHIDKLKFAMNFGSNRLLMYDELPGPWQSNQYIRTGYRFLDSAADCWYSLFYVHNETGNIWTHLLGFVALLGLGTYELFFSGLMKNIPMSDRVVFMVFLLAACKCLMCSTVWHTLSGINNIKVYRQVACLDYVGISVLICASVMLCEYYGFYYDDLIRNTYITGTATLAIIGVSMPFQAWFDQHERRWLRIAFFIALASSGAIVFGHLAIVRGFQATCSWLAPVFKSVCCYLAGVVIYGNQFPEKFWPGKFDHLAHSHQFWHIFVCGGIWFHYQAALQFALTREEFGLCKP